MFEPERDVEYGTPDITEKRKSSLLRSYSSHQTRDSLREPPLEEIFRGCLVEGNMEGLSIVVRSERGF